MKYPFANIDFETLGTSHDAAVLSFACVLFDPRATDSFPDLVNDPERTFYCKFDVTNQKGRRIDRDTLEWWSQQGEEAQAVLKPSEEDISVPEFLQSFKDFLEDKIDPKNTIFMCRGQSFDFPLMDSLVAQYGDGIIPNHTRNGFFPCPFWNQQDVRTAFKWVLGSPEQKKAPVEKGLFEGFVKHNCLHDVCKDVIVLQECLKYALGKKDIPDDPEWI